jgi:hypothetical protein
MGRHGYDEWVVGRLNRKQVLEWCLNSGHVSEDDNFDRRTFEVRDGNITTYASLEEARSRCGGYNNDADFTYFMHLTSEKMERFKSLKTTVNLLDRIEQARSKVSEVVGPSGNFWTCPHCKSRINTAWLRLRYKSYDCPACSVEYKSKALDKARERLQKLKDSLDERLATYRAKHGVEHTFISITSDHY